MTRRSWGQARTVSVGLPGCRLDRSMPGILCRAEDQRSLWTSRASGWRRDVVIILGASGILRRESCGIIYLVMLIKSLRSASLVRTSPFLQYLRRIFSCDMCALFYVGTDRAVTGSADRNVRYFDIRRSQANIICSLKSNSRVDSGNKWLWFLFPAPFLLTYSVYIYAVAVSSDSSTVASGHQDGGLRIWNIQQGAKIHSIPKLHSSHISSVQFDPKRGNRILTASKDNTLTVIETRTYEPLLVILICVI